MNLPTKLTLSRIVIVVVMLIGLFTCDILHEAGVLTTMPTLGPINVAYLICFVLFIIASITDALDGKIARKYNLVTDMGKFLDPVADKLLVNLTLIYLALPHFGLANQATIPLFCVIIMIGRDLIIDAFRLAAASKGSILAANIFGKLKTVFQMIAIPMVLLNSWPFAYFDGGWDNYLRICNIAVYLATAMSLLSLIIYLKQNWHILTEEKQK
ncbi:MAG: CDP-diacylglycerol--glycerol-3-phosphate 3-phosphatidyltransferase [Bacilli bacterium]|nr:CDP-diacylglycerol--glycerol-3-phosphate 3-phosphatidyltransferase [Bacilli bacterium]